MNDLNDFEKFKDILEMAEVLTNESESSLEVLACNETTGGTNTVFFQFNSDGELIEVYTEN